MSDPLIVSVSGIRGIVGTSLTPHEAMRFAAAFGAPLAGRVVAVARDGRTTGDMVADAVKAGLAAVGCEVVDLGIAATPTIGYYVKHVGAGGGVQVSASHNPPEWNGLKLFRPEGFVLSPDAGRRVVEAYEASSAKFVTWDRVKPGRTEPDPHGPHLERVLSLVDVEVIRQRRFKVVLDANHGSGGASVRSSSPQGRRPLAMAREHGVRGAHGAQPVDERAPARAHRAPALRVLAAGRRPRPQVPSRRPPCRARDSATVPCRANSRMRSSSRAFWPRIDRRACPAPRSRRPTSRPSPPSRPPPASAPRCGRPPR